MGGRLFSGNRILCALQTMLIERRNCFLFYRCEYSPERYRWTRTGSLIPKFCSQALSEGGAINLWGCEEALKSSRLESFETIRPNGSLLRLSL